MGKKKEAISLCTAIELSLQYTDRLKKRAAFKILYVML